MTDAMQTRSGFWAELPSWRSPDRKEVDSIRSVGSHAPTSSRLPLPNGNPTVVLFLRHCGCPFAEKSFQALATFSNKNKDVRCIAVSQSTAEATNKWIQQIDKTSSVDVIVDESRDLYAQWGLDVSNTWHVLSPWVFYSLYRLGKDEGIWNRPTESGSRWQKGGWFAVDDNSVVQLAHVSRAADDIPDFETARKALQVCRSG